MKIVITGGLGYVGTELCRLYSGRSRVHEIVVFDNRFLSERVKQLRVWGIEFVQGSILDKDLVAKVFHKADIVFHLAGITDVAYVKTENNSEQDNLIKRVAIEGTNNILDCLSPETRIIFPSTHVVFEGLDKVTLDVEEDTPTCPILTYAQSKVQNEQDIQNKASNWIILRLGSSYGMSEDSMRVNIMPNLFSKITALDGEIKLFGGGKQYKSLVHVVDVARCMMFMADRPGIRNQIFHLSHENVTVKDVAAICRRVNPYVIIKETNDAVPNLGYTMSNKKLLATGFQFLYNISFAVEDMIEKWSAKLIPNCDNEIIERGINPYVDARGSIMNYELPEPINLVGCITSVANTIRANHFHPVQEQKCLLVKGMYVSFTLDLLKPDAKVEARLIVAGDLAIIPPNVAHAMVFVQDSVFLNLVNGERNHANYGITHTIPYKLVDAEEIPKYTNSNYVAELFSHR